MPGTFYAEDGPQGFRGGKTVLLCGLGEERVNLTKGCQDGGWRVALPQEGYVVHLGAKSC